MLHDFRLPDQRERRSILGLPVRIAIAYLAIFLLGLGAYSVLWPQAPVKAADSREYMAMAQELSRLQLTTLHERTPGYPLLLVLTDSSDEPRRALFLVSLLLHCAAIWLIAALLHELNAPGAGLLVFAILLMLPPYVEPAGYVLSENLTEFLLSAAFASLIWSIMRRNLRLLIIAALLLVSSAFARPTNIAISLAISAGLVAVAAAIPTITWRTALRTAAALTLTSLILLAAYSAFNWRHFDYFGVTPKLGFSLSTRTLRFLERAPSEHAAVREALIRARDESLTRRNSSHLGNQFIWGGVIGELQTITGMTRTELSKYMLRFNLSLMAKAPLEYMLEACRGLAGYWFPQTGALANLGSRRFQALWTVLDFGLSALFALQLVVVVGAALVWLSLRATGLRPEQWTPPLNIPAAIVPAYVLAGTIVFYTALVSCFVEVGDMRYRSPTLIFIAFMTFAGLHCWRQALATMRQTQGSPRFEPRRHTALAD